MAVLLERVDRGERVLADEVSEVSRHVTEDHRGDDADRYAELVLALSRWAQALASGEDPSAAVRDVRRTLRRVTSARRRFWQTR